VKLTNGAWPDAKTAPSAPLGPPVAPPAAAPATHDKGNLAATGPTPWLFLAAFGLLLLAVVLRRQRTV
jgi:hypothetical protein